MSTGVMHQIRVHANRSDCPLAFDSIYNSNIQNPREEFSQNFCLHHIGILIDKNEENNNNEMKEEDKKTNYLTSPISLPQWAIEKNFTKKILTNQKNNLSLLQNLILH